VRHGMRWLGAAPACALVLAAVACGSQAASTAAGGSTAASGSPAPAGSPSASASVPASGPVAASGSPSPASSSPAAIPAAILNAVTARSSARIDVVTSPASVLAHPAASQAAALRTALAQEPRGSKLLGLSLARVKGFGFGSDMTRSQLAWLASIDPYGGAYGAGGRACGRISFDIEFIDPATGKWLMATAGRSPGLRPLPQLGPAPSPVQPSPSCGGPAPRVRLGTPAAY
jgi:hypothetical protein